MILLRHRCLRAALSVLTIVGVCLSLTGCYDATEVETLNVVVGLGVDETEDGKVEVTTEVVKPIQHGKDQQGDRASFALTTTGPTIEKALNDIDRLSPRRMYYPHNTVVVFGKRYAERGLDRAFDHLDRDPSYRRNQLILVTEGTAQDLLQSVYQTQKVTAFGLRQLIDRDSDMSDAFNSEQTTVMRQYFEPSHTPVITVLNISPWNMPFVAGIGLFKQGKLTTILHFPQANGLLWTLGRTQQIMLTFPMSTNGGSGPDTDPSESNKANSSGSGGVSDLPSQNAIGALGDLKTSIRVLRTATDVHLARVGTRYTADVNVNGEFEVDHLAKEHNLTSKEVAQLESHVNQEITKQIKSAVSQMQDADVDGTQFASQLYRDQPGVWKQIATQWDNVFPQVQVQVHVHTHMLRSNLSGRSATSVYTPSGSLPPED